MGVHISIHLSANPAWRRHKQTKSCTHERSSNIGNRWTVPANGATAGCLPRFSLPWSPSYYKYPSHPQQAFPSHFNTSFASLLGLPLHLPMASVEVSHQCVRSPSHLPQSVSTNLWMSPNNGAVCRSYQHRWLRFQQMHRLPLSKLHLFLRHRSKWPS